MLGQLEALARKIGPRQVAEKNQSSTHPFDQRGLCASFPKAVLTLFDSGHFPQATFEALKYLEYRVRVQSGLRRSGVALMMQAFSGANPAIRLNPLKSQSERDEQEGYKFLFAGSIQAIRNPRGHEYDLLDDRERCLAHLGLASMLLKRLEEAGYFAG